MDNSPDAIVINLLKYILYTYKTIVLESNTTSLFDLIVEILFVFCLKANTTAYRIMLGITNCRYIQFYYIPMSITLLKTAKLYKMLTLIIKSTYTYLLCKTFCRYKQRNNQRCRSADMIHDNPPRVQIMRVSRKHIIMNGSLIWPLYLCYNYHTVLMTLNNIQFTFPDFRIVFDIV